MGRLNCHEPAVASSSTTIKAQGCSWSAESVHYIRIRHRYLDDQFRPVPDDLRPPLLRQTKGGQFFTLNYFFPFENLPIALLKAKAFRSPVTTTTTSLLSSTVATPTVRAMRGTAEISLLKKRALASIVS